MPEPLGLGQIPLRRSEENSLGACWNVVRLIAVYFFGQTVNAALAGSDSASRCNDWCEIPRRLEATESDRYVVSLSETAIVVFASSFNMSGSMCPPPSR